MGCEQNNDGEQPAKRKLNPLSILVFIVFIVIAIVSVLDKH